MKGFIMPVLLLWLSFIILVPKVNAKSVQDIIVQKTLEWNTVNNELNVAKMTPLYAEYVVGYAKGESREAFMKRKESFFQNAKDFTQVILSDLTLKFYNDGKVKCEFDKRATWNGKARFVPSYLIFEKIEGEYLIIEESDNQSNTFFNYQPPLGTLKKVKVLSTSDLKTGSNLSVFIILGVIILGTIIYFTYRVKRIKVLHAEKITANSKTIPTQIISEQYGRQVSEIKSTRKVDSKSKGDDFEHFIFRSFDPKYFKLVNWVSDKGLDGRYAENNRDPDIVMRFTHASESIEFAVECKYRGSFDSSDQVDLCESFKLSHYKEYGKKNKIDVFMAIGVGGKPGMPEKLFIVPINEIQYPIVNRRFLENYWKNPGTNLFYSSRNSTLK